MCWVWFFYFLLFFFLGNRNRMGKLYSLSLLPEIGKSGNLVRLGVISIYIYCLEIDAPLLLCRQRLEQSTSLQILGSSNLDDNAVYHLINRMKKVQWSPMSCRLCMLPASATLACHSLWAPVQRAGMCYLRLSELMQLLRKKKKFHVSLNST